MAQHVDVLIDDDDFVSFTCQQFRQRKADFAVTDNDDLQCSHLIMHFAVL